MSKIRIIDLFDNEQYEEVYDLTNPYNKNILNDYEILYFLKTKLALDDFQIKDKNEIKKLLFYYFYIVGSVEFENKYSFSFNKELLKISFKNLEKNIEWLSDFKQYFDLGKNEIFLNKIIDKSLKNNNWKYKKWSKEVNNIVDFFILFTYECSELYAFKWEHFPLFKWLINKLED